MQQGERLRPAAGLRVARVCAINRRLIAAAAAALLAAGCAGSATPRAAPSSTSPTASASAATTRTTAPSTPAANPLAAYYAQRLTWRGCGGGFQCSTLTVPLDYQQPAGRRIAIAVIRLPAADPGQRIGSLVINPGGPGGSGIDYARAARAAFTQAVRNRFDIVGFDPRGVGQSTPLHCLTGPQLDHYFHVDPTPDNQSEINELVATDQQLASGCEKDDPGLVHHISTLEQARDMDVLRVALGDAKLTYLGKSYGTYLGAKYAQQYPKNIRAMVLDGALDPTQSALAEDKVQAEGFERELRGFIAWCVGQGGCPLGASTSSATQTFDRLQASVDTHELPSASSRTVGQGEFFLGVAASLYDPASGWPALRAALAQALDGRGDRLLVLSDALTGRNPDGTYSNLQETNAAINCVDRPSPRTLSAYADLARQLASVAPHFGPAIAWGNAGCAYWAAPPVEQPHAVSAPGAPPILVVGTTRDPATPYVWAQALARQLSSGVLLTYNGDGHTAYERGSSCVDRAVDAYLISLTVTPDQHC
ncbi:MAG TPA: alpha/beta hydrolase [Mycobacteriales bacterium]|nr:alpha/beta hydrolase [Mycobacteriales bacterium]